MVQKKCWVEDRMGWAGSWHGWGTGDNGHLARQGSGSDIEEGGNKGDAGGEKATVPTFNRANLK